MGSNQLLAVVLKKWGSIGTNFTTVKRAILCQCKIVIATLLLKFNFIIYMLYCRSKVLHKHFFDLRVHHTIDYIISCYFN